MSIYITILETIGMMSLLYGGILIICTDYYFNYLNGRLNKIEFMIRGLLLLSIILGTLLISKDIYSYIIAYIGSKLPSFNYLAPLIVQFMIFTPLLIYRIREKHRFSCKEKEIVKDNEVKYYICHTDIFNAWYDRNLKEYYISKKLYDVLSPTERLAIIYHEEGHAKNRFTNNLSIIMFGAWYFVAANIVLFILLFWFESPSAWVFLAIAVLLVPFIPMATLIAMTISWINEHESDIRAKNKVGKDAIINALIKAYLYATLHRYNLLNYTRSIKVDTKIPANNPSFFRVLLVLFRYSFNVPLWIIDFIKRPLYITHPPLEFRITKILNA